MQHLLANIFDNPILVRELRRRMRGKALVWSIIAYVAIMTIATVLVLLVSSPSYFAQASLQTLTQMKETGENIFFWITSVQVMLVLIVAPTITAGLTTGEKERKTFDFLRVTTITRWMYVLGCFLSTAFYVAIALLCALPLLSLTFLYGGVALGDVVRAFFFLLGGSCVLSAFGLYISSIVERTRTAQGIIVFLIFGSLFGGFILLSQLRLLFAGSAVATTGTGATGGAGPIYLLDIAIQPWVFAFAAMLAMAGVFLLLAARKLFEPDDTRAFSHWQFGVIVVAVLAGGIGVLGGNPAANELPEIAFLAVGCALLVTAVQSFAVGRMEVGDEIWHLKRLVPVLRPIDQTVPFLFFIGAVWYIALSVMPGTVKTPRIPPGLIESLKWVSLSSFAFFCFLARGLTVALNSRRRAGLWSGATVAGFWLAVPLLCWLLTAALPSLNWLWQLLSTFSPVALLTYGLNDPTLFTSGGLFFGAPIAVVYGAAAVVTAIWGESLRFRRWRGFDYHYDMPVG